MTNTDDALADGLMTSVEVCQYFRIGKTTLYEWANRGLLQGIKVAGSRRWLRRSVLDCAARHVEREVIVRDGDARQTLLGDAAEKERIAEVAG